MTITQRLSSLFLVSALCFLFAPFANAEGPEVTKKQIKQEVRACRTSSDSRSEKIACVRSVLEAHRNFSPRIEKKLERLNHIEKALDLCGDKETREEKKACFDSYAEENDIEFRRGKKKFRRFFKGLHPKMNKMQRLLRNLPEEVKGDVLDCSDRHEDRDLRRECIRSVVDTYRNA